MADIMRWFQTRSFIIAVGIIAQTLFCGPKILAHVGTGIDVDRQGRIYFTDTSHNRIWKLDLNGSLTAISAGLHFDYLIVGDDDNLYIIADSIWRITPQGQMSEFLGAAQFPKEGSSPVRPIPAARANEARDKGPQPL